MTLLAARMMFAAQLGRWLWRHPGQTRVSQDSRGGIQLAMQQRKWR